MRASRHNIRVLCLFGLLIFAVSTFAQNAGTNQNVPNDKTPEVWVTEVLRLALEIRIAEEAYETDLKDCTNKRREMNPDRISCLRANQALAMSQTKRTQYQRLLEDAEKSSVSVEWLKAHFAWVRFGKEWQREHKE